MSESDYCEMCDLPRSQCIHGRPPAPPAPTPTATRAAPKPRRATTTRASAKAPKVVTKSTGRKWTAPDQFAPHILTILEDAGGELPADTLFSTLEETISEQLLPGDRETTPEGELRWRYAARRARQKLISDGLMAKGAPGVWSLA